MRGARFSRLGPTRERETPTITIVGTQMSCQCQKLGAKPSCCVPKMAVVAPSPKNLSLALLILLS